ncbi:YceI family protein [Pontimicrobium aquaticum]|uniref:YceI family protein n=1 Tax=Pontimicrobium aquaticum TaxID=2565367 RepID=A0A4U0EWB6_9FLAO|nr:YceI family protein [Pontimicrobium aquaticum]TJY36247.1 YceI family protein [Pontimicrobium aquaticum]
MKKRSIIIVVIFSLLLLNVKAYSQSYVLDKSNSTITVSGTSSLHDWDIISNNFSGNIQLKDSVTAQIETLFVSIPSESLKSGKKAMDKKTYKALKTDDYSTISFKMVKVKSSKKVDDSTFEMKLVGEITICDVTKLLGIDFLLSKTGENINATGSCKMKMTDFKVVPPTALLGTIKTGDDISIKFNVMFLTK